MAIHNELGREGEDLAAVYLTELGYMVLHRNWRFPPYEVDIIALKNGIPHFVEVKLRTSNRYGNPEGKVTKQKIRCLLFAATAYLNRNPKFSDFRLDILSVSVINGKPEYFLIEDVYV